MEIVIVLVVLSRGWPRADGRTRRLWFGAVAVKFLRSLFGPIG